MSGICLPQSPAESRGTNVDMDMGGEGNPGSSGDDEESLDSGEDVRHNATSTPPSYTHTF